jgi:hypothetical protein
MPLAWALQASCTRARALPPPRAFAWRSLPFNKKRHRDIRQMAFRTRHQQESIDGVVLNAPRRKNTRNSSHFCKNTNLFNRSLNRRVGLSKAPGQLRFRFGFGPRLLRFERYLNMSLVNDGYGTLLTSRRYRDFRGI